MSTSRNRERRERELLAALGGPHPQRFPALVRTIYRDVDARLWPAAARQLLAYLIALEREGRVRATPLDTPLSDEDPRPCSIPTSASS